MSDLVMPPGGRVAALGDTLSTGRRGPASYGLAARVVVLVTSFVMLAATMTYIPAMASFRDHWLHNRLSAAYTAALVLHAAPTAMVPESLKRDLLTSVGARIIVLGSKGTKRILAAADLPQQVDEVFDLREPSLLESLGGAIRALTASPGRVLTAIGEAPIGGETIAITLDEAPLKHAMHVYSKRILLYTSVMSAVVAGLAVIAFNLVVLRPVRRLTTSLIGFGTDPANVQKIIVPSGHLHEIGQAEAALATMQERLARELSQKTHLATLGLAVAKINHDMRNMLAAAQLLSDRLANVTDPLAQRIAPKLVATLDRAIRFCQETLTYGRAVDEPPSLKRFALRPLVDDVIETVVLDGSGAIEVVDEVAADFEIVADPEQIFRALMNLVRNSVEALAQQSLARAETDPPRVWVSARAEATFDIIDVSDNGPGVPPAARPKLFTAFYSTNRAGGSGLGLVIAADLVRAHGGTIALLEKEDAVGAHFRVTLPRG
jgi:signal transduction histidine kinase